MNRTLAPLLALALVACGSSNLKSATNKTLSMNSDIWPDGGTIVRILLTSPDCPRFDDQVKAQLNGQPMKLVGPGGPVVTDGNSCAEAVWTYEGPVPTGDWHASLRDSSDDLELTVVNATETGPVSMANPTVTRGQVFEVQTQPPPNGYFSSVRVVGADGTMVGLEANALQLPDTFPTGPGQLFAQFQNQPRVTATGDVTASAILNLEAAPLPITVQ